ncbi:MAG: hypothetical protein K9L88_20850 [Chromatiaceae bacterium]|nr:hypothetical protein [Chromatiaceae bacterium]
MAVYCCAKAVDIPLRGGAERCQIRHRITWENFGPDLLEDDEQVLEAFVAETRIAA